MVMSILLFALTLSTQSARQPKSATLTVSPSSITLAPGGSQQFMATTTGTTKAPAWSATGGTITSSGLFTAGQVAGTFTVTATLPANVTGRASVTISVPPQPETWTAIFDASTDYATNVTSTTIYLYREGDDSATVLPVQTVFLGYPTPVDGVITVNITDSVSPLPAGYYYGVPVATGPGGSTSGQPSPTFVR